jgi:Asp-tRNA(Asn)/Glu-tRNA(Gln) amidotransferase A subunit family amidase
MDMDSAIEIADAVRRRETRAIDVLNEIRPLVERANDALIAIVYLDWELAERVARNIDASIERGDPVGALAGVPFGVKDLDDCAQPSVT